MAAATRVGKLVAERAIAAGVTKVVFDRGAYLYHGRVKALADAAREGRPRVLTKEAVRRAWRGRHRRDDRRPRGTATATSPS